MSSLVRNAVLATALIGAASSSTAHAGVELGIFAGVHRFSDGNALGTTDIADPQTLRNSLIGGLRLGVTFTPLLGIEVEGAVIPTEPRGLVFSVYAATFRGHLIAQFGAKDPDKFVVPFVLLGAGITNILSSGVPAVVAEDSTFSPYLGLGAKFRPKSSKFGIRAEVRGLLPGAREGESAFDYEVLLTIYRDLSKKKPAAKDTDNDGILDTADKCPTEPEDKDNFQDDDGCPDPDNDGDGIADKTDKCPAEAEDKDSFQDDDGCPEADNDNDGFPDPGDKCPNEPEDKDKFEDEDGCPDPDNDADGIPDTADKCPMEPETKNGYQDEDGCADDVPAKIKAFTGTIQGINFQLGSANLAATSNAVLDKAIAVLKEFDTLKLEIQGHTDDQPMAAGGKFADNTALSQARADAVKAYFVSKGIKDDRLTAKGYGDTQPIDPPTGKTGPELNNARTKNRRVEFKLISGGAP